MSPPSPSTLQRFDYAETIKIAVAAEFNRLKENLRTVVREILSEELKPIKDDIINIKESFSFFNQQFEDLTKRVVKAEAELKSYKTMSSELSQLKTTVSNLENRNNINDQWSRRSNIEIYGIPEKKNENLFQILNNISERTSCKIDPTKDIDFITRVSPKQSDKNKRIKPIVVRFLARYKKDDFLSEARQLKLKASDIGFTECENPIYINEHLTGANKALLHRTKSVAREKLFAYVWVKNCTIFARKNDSSPVIVVSSEQDLNKIK